MSRMREMLAFPFSDYRGIQDWRVVDDDTLLIQSRSDDWYRAELFGPCNGLRFDPTIGFVLEPSGSFDRFSSIIVDGRECSLRSLVKADAPAGERERREGAQASARDDSSQPFADLGGIQEWRPVSDELLYIRGRNGRWHRADVRGTCAGLMTEPDIGFVLEPSARFTAIVVNGRECALESLEPGSPPPGSRRADSSE